MSGQKLVLLNRVGRFNPSCRPLRRNLFSLAIVSFSATAIAQSTYDEQYKLIKAPNAVTSYGPDLFGDSVNLYNGSLEFAQTDVAIPGNSRLPVAMGRRLFAGVSALGKRPFGRWEADVPHLHGIYSSSKGWVSSTNSTMNRCTEFGAPASAAGQNNLSAWGGTDPVSLGMSIVGVRRNC